MNGVVFVETVRRHVTNLVFVTVLLIVAIIACVAGGTGSPSGIWTSFSNLAGIVLACQLIGPEFSSGTLQLVLAKPVNRSSYLIARYCGVLVAVAILFLVPALFDVGGRVLINKEHFTSAMFAGPVNGGVTFLMAAALFALFGSMSRSYINVAIYFVAEAVLYLSGMGPFLKGHPEIREGVLAVTHNLFPQMSPSFDWRWTLMIVSNSAVTVLLACLIFRQREVPYGAD